MVTASFSILFMKIKLEWHSIIFCSAGAFFGLIFGKSTKLFLTSVQSLFVFNFLHIFTFLLIK